MLLLVFVIFTSLLFKILDIYNSSTFDGKTNYNISHLGSNGWEVVSLSPYDNSIKVLNFQTSDAGKFSNLRIPQDLLAKSNNDINSENAKDILRSLVSSSKTNIFDIIRINIFLSSVDSKLITEEKIEIIDDERTHLIVSENLSNAVFLSEKLTIEIVNATGETGLGSNVARLITNMGGNVILVNTAGREEAISSIITKRENTNTVRKIKVILNIPLDNTFQPALSDVKITIGKDFAGKFR